MSYGARPDAKDVCGKTVCHYGAGSMATEMTMNVVERASGAYPTSYLFGKLVELTGLKNEAMNGKRGIAGGYVWETKRRTVYVFDDDKQISVKPENIKTVPEGVEEQDYNDEAAFRKKRILCNIQCRLGTVSLQETVMGNRLDVAKFLLDKLGADIDIADWDGFSPKSMSMNTFTELVTPVTTLIKEVARKTGKAANKADRHKCGNCSIPEPNGTKFLVCARCKQIRYCSRNCQSKFVSILFVPHALCMIHNPACSHVATLFCFSRPLEIGTQERMSSCCRLGRKRHQA